MILRTVAGVSLTLWLGLITTRSRIVDAAAQTPTPVAPVISIDPKPLYTKQCEMCHGREGKAPTPEMGFVARGWKHGTSTDEIIKSIAGGVPATAMLPFKGKLRPEEIAALARYVRSLDKRLKPEKGGG